jgi:hypothetical protein
MYNKPRPIFLPLDNAKTVDSVSRRVRLADHVARMGEIRNAYNILVGKPE